MSKTVDSIFMRFRGKVNIFDKLPIDDQDIYFLVKGEVSDETVKSNKDGTVNLIYVVDVAEVTQQKL